MRECKKQFNKIRKKYANRPPDEIDFGLGWQAALKWYQSVAEVCEKDCKTPEDFKVLYFHLKQVLKNEVKS